VRRSSCTRRFVSFLIASYRRLARIHNSAKAAHFKCEMLPTTGRSSDVKVEAGSPAPLKRFACGARRLPTVSLSGGCMLSGSPTSRETTMAVSASARARRWASRNVPQSKSWVFSSTPGVDWKVEICTNRNGNLQSRQFERQSLIRLRKASRTCLLGAASCLTLPDTRSRL
jgi:hypothetical protein